VAQARPSEKLHPGPAVKPHPAQPDSQQQPISSINSANQGRSPDLQSTGWRGRGVGWPHEGDVGLWNWGCLGMVAMEVMEAMESV